MCGCKRMYVYVRERACTRPRVCACMSAGRYVVSYRIRSNNSSGALKQGDLCCCCAVPRRGQRLCWSRQCLTKTSKQSITTSTHQLQAIACEQTLRLRMTYAHKLNENKQSKPPREEWSTSFAWIDRISGIVTQTGVTSYLSFG